MNGAANCILEICCPPGGDPATDVAVGPLAASPRAKASLAHELVVNVGLSKEDAGRTAGWIYEQFDLASRGTLHAFKADIVRVYQQQ